MTIPITNEDIAEARKLASQTIWSIDEWPDRATSYETPHILAHAQTIAKLRVAVGALGGIEIYGSDTLSGRVNPDISTYREWLIGGVREMRNRARQALAQIKDQTND